jgi:alkanesulfonate monooxygenase SsuD/methylene tetrahydromethanopterin reductase-like flavin-dependent oxidoreductase (luciferase family)
VVIRTGIILPTFRDNPDDALATAAQAFAAGVDGVFCYDHIWPIDQPERPALAPFPVLAAVAASLPGTTSARGGPYLGTLVARIGLAPNAVLLGQFAALEHLAPGRVIAGLGTGDSLSQSENVAYGIPYAPAAERRGEMVDVARTLRERGTATWIAGGSAARSVEARAAGAAVNLWDVGPELVASTAGGSDPVEVTWAGPSPGSDDELHRTVRALEGAGATWAVFGWPVDPGSLAAAARKGGPPGP